MVLGVVLDVEVEVTEIKGIGFYRIPSTVAETIVQPLIPDRLIMSIFCSSLIFY